MDTTWMNWGRKRIFHLATIFFIWKAITVFRESVVFISFRGGEQLKSKDTDIIQQNQEDFHLDKKLVMKN